MNKKDSIALVLSFVLFMFAIVLFTISNSRSDQRLGFIITLIIAIYWGYRSIINDIITIPHQTTP